MSLTTDSFTLRVLVLNTSEEVHTLTLVHMHTIFILNARAFEHHAITHRQPPKAACEMYEVCFSGTAETSDIEWNISQSHYLILRSSQVLNAFDFVHMHLHS
jgi:hypothetical protein